MRSRRSTRLLAAVTMFALAGLPAHSVVALAPATLTGSIVRSGDLTPLPGARLHVGDPRTGRIFSSTPAGGDGAFVVADLPAASYALAVEADGGLYVVETPLEVEPGSSPTVHLAVTPAAEPESTGPGTPSAKKGQGFWENPLTAALLGVGVAALIGLALDDDDSPAPAGNASPSQP